jgi:type IV pilus assembly protein PilN
VQKFEARKAQLQQRVTLIEQLRRGQSGPVHVLDEISRSVPDRLWLTAIEQKGTDFTLSGMTTSLTSVSDFIAALEGTQWFKKPVEIIDSQVQSDAKTGDLFKFSLKAVFNDPGAPPEPPAAAKPAPNKGPVPGAQAGAQQ